MPPAPPEIPGLPTPRIAADIPPVAAQPYQCMDLGCICAFMGGEFNVFIFKALLFWFIGSGRQGSNTCVLANGQPLLKAVRKEYRMLTDDERARFHNALLTLKRSGEYDRLAAIHAQVAISGSAHSGPGFLVWHREFLKRWKNFHFIIITKALVFTIYNTYFYNSEWKLPCVRFVTSSSLR